MISTHVLDTEQGAPGRGVGVSLYRGQELISHQETNEDGRIPDLSGGSDLEPGEYRLVFHIAGGFFEQVEVTIAIPDPTVHHHVPLLLAPYSCTIYRGS
jgi:5-hydroxyisourate hydrolase